MWDGKGPARSRRTRGVSGDRDLYDLPYSCLPPPRPHPRLSGPLERPNPCLCSRVPESRPSDLGSRGLRGHGRCGAREVVSSPASKDYCHSSSGRVGSLRRPWAQPPRPPPCRDCSTTARRTPSYEDPSQWKFSHFPSLPSTDLTPTPSLPVRQGVVVGTSPVWRKTSPWVPRTPGRTLPGPVSFSPSFSLTFTWTSSLGPLRPETLIQIKFLGGWGHSFP